MSMTDPSDIEEGTKIVRRHSVYYMQGVDGDEVCLLTRYGGHKQEVTETLARFAQDLQDGTAVIHPLCAYCDLSVDPEDAIDGDCVGFDGPLHYTCWRQHATVQERCEAEAERPSGNYMASEALRADGDPTDHLLSVIGNPARGLSDRHEAEALLTHAVDTETIMEASVRCPNCYEGEAFYIDPTTGDVTCHCGQLMQSGGSGGDE